MRLNGLGLDPRALNELRAKYDPSLWAGKSDVNADIKLAHRQMRTEHYALSFLIEPATVDMLEFLNCATLEIQIPLYQPSQKRQNKTYSQDPKVLADLQQLQQIAVMLADSFKYQDISSADRLCILKGKLLELFEPYKDNKPKKTNIGSLYITLLETIDKNRPANNSKITDQNYCLAQCQKFQNQYMPEQEVKLSGQSVKPSSKR